MGGLGWLWWLRVTAEYGGVDQEMGTRKGKKSLKLWDVGLEMGEKMGKTDKASHEMWGWRWGREWE